MKNMNTATESTVNPTATESTVVATESPIFTPSPFGVALSAAYLDGNKRMMNAATLKTINMTPAEYRLFMVSLQTVSNEYAHVRDAYARAGKVGKAEINALKEARTPVYNKLDTLFRFAGCLADASDADFAAKFASDLNRVKTTTEDGSVVNAPKEVGATAAAKFVKAIEWLIGAKLNGVVWYEGKFSPLTDAQRDKLVDRIKKEEERRQAKEKKEKEAAVKASATLKRMAEKEALKEAAKAAAEEKKKAEAESKAETPTV